MQKLIQGVHHFQANIFGTQRGLFERLAQGQSPESFFITCSDSRIDPNLLTQTIPGDLFIARNAGNIVPPHGATVHGEAATIEFAVVGLGVKDIIICGHSNCGAMKALLKPSSTDKMPAVAAWLNYAEAARHIVEDNYGHLDEEHRLNATIQENVLVQLESLMTLPCVASRLVRGNLRIHGWVYKFETGEVYAYDPGEGQFLPLTATSSSAMNDGQRSIRVGA